MQHEARSQKVSKIATDVVAEPERLHLHGCAEPELLVHFEVPVPVACPVAGRIQKLKPGQTVVTGRQSDAKDGDVRRCCNEIFTGCTGTTFLNLVGCVADAERALTERPIVGASGLSDSGDANLNLAVCADVWVDDLDVRSVNSTDAASELAVNQTMRSSPRQHEAQNQRSIAAIVTAWAGHARPEVPVTMQGVHRVGGTRRMGGEQVPRVWLARQIAPLTPPHLRPPTSDHHRHHHESCVP